MPNDKYTSSEEEEREAARDRQERAQKAESEAAEHRQGKAEELQKDPKKGFETLQKNCLAALAQYTPTDELKIKLRDALIKKINDIGVDYYGLKILLSWFGELNEKLEKHRAPGEQTVAYLRNSGLGKWILNTFMGLPAATVEREVKALEEDRQRVEPEIAENISFLESLKLEEILPPRNSRLIHQPAEIKGVLGVLGLEGSRLQTLLRDWFQKASDYEAMASYQIFQPIPEHSEALLSEPYDVYLAISAAKAVRAHKQQRGAEQSQEPVSPAAAAAQSAGQQQPPEAETTKYDSVTSAGERLRSRSKHPDPAAVELSDAVKGILDKEKPKPSGGTPKPKRQ